MTTATQLASAPSTPENLLTQPAALAAAPAPATASQDQASTRETPPFDEQLLMLLAPDHAEPQAGAADDTVQLAGQPPADTPPAASSAGQTSEQNLEQAEALLGLFSAQQQQQVQAQVPAARPQASGATAGAANPLPPEPVETPVTPPIPSRPEPAATSLAMRADVPAAAANESSATPESLALATAVRPVSETAPAVERPVTAPPTQPQPLAERLVKLEGSDSQRGEQMLHALRNNVQLQLHNKQQIATIRLDPPELGSLEIQVSQESGRISVQINAAQADTLRLLQLTSDRLRHELLTQQFDQVNVQVAGEGHSGQQSRRNRGGSDEALVRGNPLDDREEDSRRGTSSDVLATV